MIQMIVIMQLVEEWIYSYYSVRHAQGILLNQEVKESQVASQVSQ